MGMMKAFLMETISEYAIIMGLTEKEVYNNPERYALALKYVDKKLKGVVARVDEEIKLDKIRTRIGNDE